MSGSRLPNEKAEVVVGASGPLGRALLNRIVGPSKNVRAVVFGVDGKSAPFPKSVEVVEADPRRRGELSEACGNAAIIYDCFDPASPAWRGSHVEVRSSTLLAAIETGAEFVYGSHLTRSESDNKRPESDVIAANDSKLTKTVVVRMPQLLGRGVSNQLWKQIFESASKGKKAHWLGDPHVLRSFLDVDDAAEAMLLLGRTPRALGRAWNISPPEPLSGTRIVELSFLAARKPFKMGVWGRGVMLTGSLLARDAKRYLEIPYDYYRPFVLDGSEFRAAFPAFSFSSPQATVEKALRWNVR